MASLESYGVDEYGNSNGVNLPDFTGCLLLATTPTPPAGTLVADGSEVSRASYPELFAKIGTTYGDGDGKDTFNVPDWQGLSQRRILPWGVIDPKPPLYITYREHTE